MKTPAFTPVAARRSLGSSEQPKQIVWPQAVRDYVQRSFDLTYQKHGVTRDDIAAKLKTIISSYAETDTMDLVDWKSMPLPHAIILEERAKEERKLSSASAPPPIYIPPQSYASAVAGKRTSAEAGFDNSAAPPWRKTNPNNRQDAQSSLTPEIDGIEAGNASCESPKGPVVGTCQELEKRYLRLTSAPDPALVRPQPVLEKTLDLLKKKLKKEDDYNYICNQFKSMRQDLMVQHIKNEFTVTVYEIHARVALEKGDLGEYNQCQTQLRSLYQQGIKGHPQEFLAYRILYYIHTGNMADMSSLLARLTPEDKQSPPVKHALQVRNAVATGNHHLFFQLYLDTPNMGGYLVEMFAARERLSAMARITRSYKGKVRLRFLTEELGFESDQECARFLVEYVPASYFSQEEEAMFTMDTPAFRIFEEARRAAYGKVDIKGQL